MPQDKKKPGSSYTTVPSKVTLTKTARMAASRTGSAGKPAQKKVKLTAASNAAAPLKKKDGTTYRTSASYNFGKADASATVTGKRKTPAAKTTAVKAKSAPKKKSSLAAVGSQKRMDQYNDRNWAHDSTVRMKPKAKGIAKGTDVSSIKTTKPKVATSKKLTGSAKTRAKGEAALAGGNTAKAQRLRRRYDRQVKRGK